MFDDALELMEHLIVELAGEVLHDQEPIRFGHLAGFLVVLGERGVGAAQELLHHQLDVRGEGAQQVFDRGIVAAHLAGDEFRIVVAEADESGDGIAHPQRIDDAHPQVLRGEGAQSPGKEVADDGVKFLTIRRSARVGVEDIAELADVLEERSLEPNVVELREFGAGVVQCADELRNDCRRQFPALEVRIPPLFDSARPRRPDHAVEGSLDVTDLIAKFCSDGRQLSSVLRGVLIGDFVEVAALLDETLGDIVRHGDAMKSHALEHCESPAQMPAHTGGEQASSIEISTVQDDVVLHLVESAEVVVDPSVRILLIRHRYRLDATFLMQSGEDLPRPIRP
ncbi:MULTISPECIES: hypothetical protein [Brevibacterium]|uniref:hypothetical protein n=1 Tax=Brevibacterium TaxID=1696 RepID=UPI0015F028BC|nr:MULTISPECIES: hypothetical protein [Brevibacterium]